MNLKACRVPIGETPASEIPNHIFWSLSHVDQDLAICGVADPGCEARLGWLFGSISMLFIRSFCVTGALLCTPVVLAANESP